MSFPSRVGNDTRRAADFSPRGAAQPEACGASPRVLPGALTNSSHRARSALTLVEAVISIALVGVMLVAALNTVGASQTTQKKMGDRNRAMLLAQDLLAEIVQQAYMEPGQKSSPIAVEGGEAGGKRDRFDDVDDYDGWSASPPQERDGTVLSDFVGWRRSVAVDWVNSINVAQVLGSDTGVKRITVTVAWNDLPLATLVALRTNALQYGPEEE